MRQLSIGSTEMNTKIRYDNSQTLDGEAATMEDSMKKASHPNHALFDNQDKKKGAVITKRGTQNLYFLFYYFGKRVEISTKLKDTPENRQKARSWLDRQMDKIDQGTFQFAEGFPGANEKIKAQFARMEGNEYFSQPKDILFEDFVRSWYETVWSAWEDGTRKDDWRQIIDSRLLPYFRKKTFAQITYMEVRTFISSLKKKNGAALSEKRIKNILGPLRKIWKVACKQYQWALFDPFEDIHEDLPKADLQKREGFRFDEAMKLFHYMDPWYRPIAELMLLTGMIHSELAGLKKKNIYDGFIHIRTTIVRDRERDQTKTKYRTRKIPITAAIQQRLDILALRTDGERLITTRGGMVFRASNFMTKIWNPAMEESELPRRVPYCLRHSFAAWSLAIGAHPNRLVALMGHCDKKMIYERYGNYIDGLAEDTWQIREYFGLDFLTPEIKGMGPQLDQLLTPMSLAQALGHPPHFTPETRTKNLMVKETVKGRQ